jgi:tetratricopeptide (TPR) repeat protein
MPTIRLTIALSVVSAFASVSLAEESTQRTKQYRPLEAKAVSIEAGAKAIAIPEQPRTVACGLRKAWGHFDLREWDEAYDAFYSVLEIDSENTQAAEGLAMSLYQAGDYSSAFRLGKELKEAMPSVQRILGETLLADVRYMIRKGEFEAAKEFLAYFPNSAAEVATARQMVTDANTITAAVGPDEDLSPVPAKSETPKTSFAKNY